MCRLLYVKSDNEFEIKYYLKRFAEICETSKEYQGHGWGFAYWQDKQWNYYKNISPVWKDNLYQFGNSKRIIVHARSAFQDKDIFIENNMPFYDYKHIFIFNGELRGVKINADGRIGAEKIFNFIKRFDKGNMFDAVKKGVEIIKKRTEYIRALNFMIADDEQIYLNSLFNEDEEYFTMHKKVSEDKLIICSDPFINDTGWKKISNNFTGVFK